MYENVGGAIMASKKSVNKQPKFVGFGESVRNFWRQAFDFRGCTSRGQFWFVMLFLALLNMPLIILNTMASLVYELSGEMFGFYVFSEALYYLVQLVLLVPLMALWFRRFHDTGRSAWPMFALWIAFVVLMFGMVLMWSSSDEVWMAFVVMTVVIPAVVASVIFSVWPLIIAFLPSKLENNPYRKIKK